jgi:hypothetical protein
MWLLLVVPHARQAWRGLEIDQVGVEAELLDEHRAEQTRSDVALEVGDEGQVLLIAEQDIRPRTTQGLGVSVEEARAWHGQEGAAGRIPRVGGMDLKLTGTHTRLAQDTLSWVSRGTI